MNYPPDFVVHDQLPVFLAVPRRNEFTSERRYDRDGIHNRFPILEKPLLNLERLVFNGFTPQPCWSTSPPTLLSLYSSDFFKDDFPLL